MGFLDGRDAQGNPLANPGYGGDIAVSGASVLGWADATGTQNYECQMKDGAPAWVNIGPNASLSDDSGAVGQHYGGPSAGGPIWSADEDGSVARCSLPPAGSQKADGAIAWLKLDAFTAGGSGIMGRVRHIQRVDTRDGLPPAEVDESMLGQQVSSGYAARYWFFGDLPEEAAPEDGEGGESDSEERLA